MFSPPARLAAPDEGITVDELRMAARNHGMPLEMLAHDVTPVGLHYLLVHYDIPGLDHAVWRLEIGGHVERPLVLDLDELRRPPVDDAPGHPGMRRQRAGHARSPAGEPAVAR